MTQLYLVRHGETEWSKSGQHTGHTDIELTKRGQEQAAALREPLSQLSFDAVYSSPLQRARKTAELAGFSEVGLHDDLMEWDYGQLEGRTSKDIQRDYPDWRIWTGEVPGGESAEQVVARLQRFIAEVRSSEHQKVLVFAHGHSLRVLTLAWLDLPITAGELFEIDTATLSVLDEDENGPKVLRWNCPMGARD